MSRKLPHPFNYYWTKYVEGQCPFCNEETEFQSFENLDVINCSVYGGYLSTYQDVAFAGADGLCRQCAPTDSVELIEKTSPYRTIVRGQGFLCESCGHGVSFDEKKVFQELFKRHDEKNCTHCTWHNKHSPANRIEKPDT